MLQRVTLAACRQKGVCACILYIYTDTHTHTYTCTCTYISSSDWPDVCKDHCNHNQLYCFCGHVPAFKLVMYLCFESQDELVAVLHIVYGAPSSCATPPAVEEGRGRPWQLPTSNNTLPHLPYSMVLSLMQTRKESSVFFQREFQNFGRTGIGLGQNGSLQCRRGANLILWG